MTVSASFQAEHALRLVHDRQAELRAEVAQHRLAAAAGRPSRLESIRSRVGAIRSALAGADELRLDLPVLRNYPYQG